jgi:hypothetical protein
MPVLLCVAIDTGSHCTMGKTMDNIILVEEQLLRHYKKAFLPVQLARRGFAADNKKAAEAAFS